MPTTTRIPFETVMRAAAVQMLSDYAQDASVKLQVYPARPRSVNPPTAFIDTMTEAIAWSPGLRERLVRVNIRIVWGLFDSAEAAAQRDEFVDQFIDWTTDRPHAADGNTIIEPRAIDDDPVYVPEWLPIAQQIPYFSTLITLEGSAGGY